MFSSGRVLVEAAALVLEGAGGTLFVTSLNKALFYADLQAIIETGKPITGTTYVALPAGPVVAKYRQRLVAALEEAGLAEQDDTGDVGKPLYLIAQPVRKLVTEEHARILRDAAAWAKAQSASQLSDYSHDNPGWKAAWDAGLGAKAHAQPINLRIAVQQLLDDDPWMNAPG